ncbi:MAG: hypothetical protein ACLQGP_13300 [Isosphaeraceae bacterium]
MDTITGPLDPNMTDAGFPLRAPILWAVPMENPAWFLAVGRAGGIAVFLFFARALGSRFRIDL